MGYQALLFCPDGKTARVVTQVLSELEFEVDPCVETFAAVKKLMGAHFDAVVVDCENEQNATLLFKSARNSASNQTALAVAVVEGQAGVAKAFRIGANLVLTKPINIEQAKGTLRVARGLLRKGESAKAAHAPSEATTQPVAEPAPKPVLPTIPVKPAAGSAKFAPVKPVPVVAPSIEKPAAKPAWPAPAAAAASAAASQKSAPHDDEVSEIILEEDTPEPPAKLAPPIPAAAAKAPVISSKPAPPIRPVATTSSGAASAPARAPEVKTPAAKSVADLAVEHPLVTEETEAPAPSHAPAPSFTFGGANVPESSGGSKKVLLSVAAIVIVAALGYFGWTSYQSSQTSSPTITAPKAAVTQPHPAQPSAPKTEVPVPSPAASQPAAAAPNVADDTEAAETPAKPSASKKSSSSPKNAESASSDSAAPLVVKGGSVASVKGKAAVADVAAPSVIGMAAGSSGELPPNLATTSNVSKPVLQRMSISQGVSRGLLIKEVKPVYPPNALRLRRQGTVQLTATISKTGAVTSVKLLSGDEQFNKAATDAVKQWKYKPYLLNGEPIEVQTPITIDFKLPD